MESFPVDPTAVAEFRRRVRQDPTYRSWLATDPAGALRELGLVLPEGTPLPAFDPAAIEERLAQIGFLLGEEALSRWESGSPDVPP